MHAASRRLAAILPLAALVLAGCSDVTGSAATGNLRFNLSTRGSGSAAAASGLSADVAPLEITDGTNTLIITDAKLVVRKIELQRTGAGSACVSENESENESESANDDDAHGDRASDESDDCSELELGPVLLDIPLTPGVSGTLNVEIAAGEYRRVEFQFHKPSGSNDTDFIAAHPEMAGASIRVVGKYNDAPFVYTGDVTATQHITLDPPLVVAASALTDLTLLIDVGTWFRTGSGALLNPATAVRGQPNESIVKNNIQRGFHAFEDHNRNGQDD
ncbi:MAG: hypothetical protein H0U85_04355 [Gemmatimonadales bacterium]|nr:hypothetical protein [Gemmatimonadales bacterium]